MCRAPNGTSITRRPKTYRCLGDVWTPLVGCANPGILHLSKSAPLHCRVYSRLSEPLHARVTISILARYAQSPGACSTLWCAMLCNLCCMVWDGVMVRGVHQSYLSLVVRAGLWPMVWNSVMRMVCYLQSSCFSMVGLSSSASDEKYKKWVMYGFVCCSSQVAYYLGKL